MESEYITKDNIYKIWEYINSRDDNIAKVFYLHFILDMTFKQISEELELNESTIKNSLYRMLKNIKKLMLGGGNNEK